MLKHLVADLLRNLRFDAITAQTVALAVPVCSSPWLPSWNPLSFVLFPDPVTLPISESLIDDAPPLPTYLFWMQYCSTPAILLGRLGQPMAVPRAAEAPKHAAAVPLCPEPTAPFNWSMNCARAGSSAACETARTRKVMIARRTAWRSAHVDYPSEDTIALSLTLVALVIFSENLQRSALSCLPNYNAGGPSRRRCHAGHPSMMSVPGAAIIAEAAKDLASASTCSGHDGRADWRGHRITDHSASPCSTRSG